MKKIITLCFSLLIVIAFAQKKVSPLSKFSNSSLSSSQLGKTTAFSYIFQNNSGTYSEITGGTDINQGQIWDDPLAVVPVGFTFDLLGEKVDALDFSWGLGAEVIGVKAGESSSSRPFLFPFGADVIDRGSLGTTSMSFITYKTIGTSPNRTFIMQWKNVGFYLEGDSLGAYNDYMNFQLKIFEATDIIEFHMGPNSVNSVITAYEGLDGPYEGFIGVDTLSLGLSDQHMLNGPANNPVLDTALETVTGTPSNGTIYKFIPGTIGLNELDKEIEVSLSPNPAKSLFRISGIELQEINSIYVYDITGKEVKRVYGSDQVNIADLGAGVYFVKVETNVGIFTKKLVKS